MDLLLDELYELILYELNLEDRLSFCVMNKRLQKQCHEGLWQITYWQFYGDVDIKLETTYQDLVKVCYSWTNLINKKPFKDYKMNYNTNRLYLFNELVYKIPKEFGIFIHLEYLTIKFTNIYKLPKEIGELINLKYLDLSKNKLSTITKTIGKLTKLKILSLSYNQIKTLPTQIIKLINLRLLFLNNNQLTILPKEISNLIHLKKLKLQDNQLTMIPTSFNQLINTQIWLKGNHIPQLPLHSYGFKLILK